MKITDALKGEHGVFYSQFQFIEQSLVNANLATLQSLGAMLAAALAPHAHIEDEILFPAIESQMGRDGPTTAFRAEHQESEGMLGRLKELRELSSPHEKIEGTLAKLPKANNEDEARRMVKAVLFAAREHFAKEENMLFPMADGMLDARTLEHLGTQWAERRGVVLV